MPAVIGFSIDIAISIRIDIVGLVAFVAFYVLIGLSRFFNIPGALNALVPVLINIVVGMPLAGPVRPKG